MYLVIVLCRKLVFELNRYNYCCICYVFGICIWTMHYVSETCIWNNYCIWNLYSEVVFVHWKLYFDAQICIRNMYLFSGGTASSLFKSNYRSTLHRGVQEHTNSCVFHLPGSDWLKEDFQRVRVGFTFFSKIPGALDCFCIFKICTTILTFLLIGVS